MQQAKAILADATLLKALQLLVHQAGEAIMQVYQTADFGIETKKDDSPVTKADLDAHYCLIDGLAKLTPHITIVSEEDPASHVIPQTHNCYWLIDPLDGTKEFINRNGQFTVNLALVEDNVPSFGFVSTPIDQTLYWGGQHLGAWRLRDNTLKSLYSQPCQTPMRVVASKSHLNQATCDFIANLGDTTLVQAGSSLKLLRIAEGEADIYPRLAPTCEWDTAAAQAVLEGAGGKVTQVDSSPMVYGKANILNPHFVASS